MQSVQVEVEETPSTQTVSVDITPVVGTYDAEMIDAGGQIYNTYCTVCHSSDSVNAGLGVNLENNEYIMLHEDDELIEFITVGRLPWDEDNTTGMTMPAGGGNPDLTDEDLLNIVAYLRTLNQGVE